MSASNPPVPELPPNEGHAQPLPYPVVAVGASAGGLEALSRLLEAFPEKPGLAFLVVMPLQPHVESQAAEILSRVTVLPVQQASHAVRVEADRVYIIPPNCVMTVQDSTIVLGPRPARGFHMPIDHLFRSLAHSQKSRAIGVILSGEGSDGTLGFKDIKAEGGITFAQDEKSARHDAMPRSAISDGCVDYVLPPAQITEQLLRIARHPYATNQLPAEVGQESIGAVNQIINLLRRSTDVDFTHYKQATINRRIQRRMALRGLENMEDYLKVLGDDPVERHNLYQDFLIRVTQFFRDPESFEALKEKVFPPLLQNRPAHSPIRVWVTGCSTGEEVYSLAITLLEFLDNRPDPPGIKILATDLNEAALERARSGIYVDNIEIDVSAERLRRFFARVDGSYHISKTVRELCVFSRHNTGSDPPFSHLDLVSCRNVLIYMDSTPALGSNPKE